jgi:hypothetical protein
MKELTKDILNVIAIKGDIGYWDILAWSYKLNEDFIEKYQDKLCWHHISIYQELSQKFVEKYKHKINFDKLLYNNSIKSYSEQMQKIIILKVIDECGDIETPKVTQMTPYMLNFYNKIEMLM